MQKITGMQNMSKDAFKKTCYPNFMDKNLVNTFSFELGLILYARKIKGSKSESCVIDPVNRTITPLIRDKKNKVIKCMPTNDTTTVPLVTSKIGWQVLVYSKKQS